MSAHPIPPPSPGRPDARPARPILLAVGLVALALWGGWGLKSLKQDRLAYRHWVGFDALPFLGGDFRVHIDHTARVVAAGDTPYTARLGERADADVCAKFPYPPLVPRLFAWVSLMSPRAASIVWIAVSAGLIAGAGLAAARTRRELALVDVPAPLLVAGVLFSLPVLFCLERGQGDSLVLPLVLLAAALLRRPGRWHDVLSGLLLATAIWFKFYPGLLLIAVVALRRWTCLAAVVAGGVVIALADLPGALRSLENGQGVADWFWTIPTVHPTMHSLTLVWRQLWPALGSPSGWRLVAMAGSLGVLLPPLMIVSGRIARTPGSERLYGPWFLWLVAAGTFVPPIANDYNLIGLPLAVAAVWDRRDRVAVQIAFGFLALWLVPYPLEIGGGLRFAFKLGGLFAVGSCLLARCRDLSRQPDRTRSTPLRPHLTRIPARVEA